MTHEETNPDAPTSAASPAEQLTLPGGAKMMTRPRTAHALGISVTELRRLEQKDLPAVRDARGFHLHSEEQIIEYKLRRRTLAEANGSQVDGTLAAVAFTMFDAGASPVELVKEHQLTPSIAQQLHAMWVGMRGGFVVDGATAATIETELGYYSDTPVNSAADIVKALKALEPDEVCLGCKRRPPRFCARCFVGRPKSAVSAAEEIRLAAQAGAASRLRRATDQLSAERARRSVDASESSLDDDDEQVRRGPVQSLNAGAGRPEGRRAADPRRASASTRRTPLAQNVPTQHDVTRPPRPTE